MLAQLTLCAQEENTEKRALEIGETLNGSPPILVKHRRESTQLEINS
jgi:hypothetical protein